jgi:hypothetical protein
MASGLQWPLPAATYRSRSGETGTQPSAARILLVTGLIAFSIGAFARPAAAAGLTVILPCGCTMIHTVVAQLLGEPGWDGMFHAAAVSGGSECS